MSISPSGKLLAIGAGYLDVKGISGVSFQRRRSGYEVHRRAPFERNLPAVWLGQGNNHLFALSSSALHIYDATSTSIKEESGSPISIPEASSVIVQSLQ
jgi:hypothetical protein